MVNNVFVILLFLICFENLMEASYTCSTYNMFNETQIIPQIHPTRKHCKRCGWFYAELSNGIAWEVGYCVPLTKRLLHFKNLMAPKKRQTLQNNNVYGYPICDSDNNTTAAHVIDKYTIPPNSYLIFCSCLKDKCNSWKNVKKIVARRLKSRQQQHRQNGAIQNSNLLILVLKICIFLFFSC